MTIKKKHEENNGIDWLRESQRIHSDGTFDKWCPELFIQFYTIFESKEDNILPCGYILLPNKQETIFDELFKALKSIIKPDNSSA